MLDPEGIWARSAIGVLDPEGDLGQICDRGARSRGGSAIVVLEVKGDLGEKSIIAEREGHPEGDLVR